MVKLLNGWQSLGFSTYKEYLRSFLWKDKKEYIISLCPFCQRCGVEEKHWEEKGEVGKPLQVHHENYTRVGNEKKEDLLVVCDDCHKKIHKVKK